MPSFDEEELDAEYSPVQNFLPEILSVEIQFLCPACRSRLSVQVDSCAVAECAWCHSDFEIPSLSSLLSKKSPAAREAKPAGEKPLLTQDELEFLTARGS